MKLFQPKNCGDPGHVGGGVACMVLPAIAHIKPVKILKLKHSNSNPAPSDPSSLVFFFTFCNDLRHTNGYDDRGVSMFI